jgi:predicted N-acetyltransferase YhbS
MQVIPCTERHADEILDLWNRELGAGFPLRRRLLFQNSFGEMPVDPEASWLVRDSGKKHAAGFVLSKRVGSDTGVISAMAVAAEYRRRGIGSQLLSLAEEALWRRGARRIVLGGDPHHYFPGVPVEIPDAAAWFRRRGYASSGTVCDLCGRSGRNASDAGDPPLPDKAAYRLANEGDREPFLRFMHREFPGRWEELVRRHYAKGGTGREFVLAAAGNEIVGFCRINDRESPTVAASMHWADLHPGRCGGIGPLGVAAEQRGRGWGIGVLQAAVSELHNRGVDTILIDWVADGTTAFYGKLGFRVWKRNELLSKQR